MCGVCVKTYGCTCTSMPGVGEERRGLQQSRSGKIIKKVRRTIGKLGGQEHRERTFVRRKLKTGMIPKQKKPAKDPVL